MADLTTCLPLNRASVVEAHKLVKPHVHYTPVLTNKTLTTLASTPRSPEDLKGTRWEGRTPAKPTLRLWFKCENLQRIGAFKVRGAFHAVERLKQEPGWIENGGMEKGVVTHSSGNHAQALALAAKEAGIPAHIREAVADRVIAETGARLVPPYDHPDIMLGQGTLGLELQEQVRDLIAAGHSAQNPTFNSTGQPSASEGKGLDAIMTPCGGGGMLSGVALSCEGTGIRVFGAEPEFQGADDCKRGFEAGKRVESVKTLTIADGLRTPVGKFPWGVIYERRLVENMFSVSEEEIKAAVKLVFERFKLVVEPSGAVPLAVALFNEDFRSMVEKEAGEKGWDLGLVFSGGNMAMEGLRKIFAS
uniref:Pyridoxal-phosphate dependent n=1 Tax=Colletotrichum fructicola (strain Nara gc5) TaxID=1213859 RepID=L2FWP5_COLFN